MAKTITRYTHDYPRKAAEEVEDILVRKEGRTRYNVEFHPFKLKNK